MHVMERISNQPNFGKNPTFYYGDTTTWFPTWDETSETTVRNLPSYNQGSLQTSTCFFVFNNQNAIKRHLLRLKPELILHIVKF